MSSAAGPGSADGESADRSDLRDLLGGQRVVPVVTVDATDTIVDLAAALAAGGLRAIEITLRTPDALAAISLAADGAPGAVIGAGTVTSAHDATAAIDAGARFVVSPGLDEGVVAAARRRGVPVVPGVATPTELMRAAALGIDTVKLFPVEILGGVDFVRALAAVWPAMDFVPTGGVSPTTAPDYLVESSVVAVGGSWMVDRGAVSDRRWDDVRSAAATAKALGEQRP